MRKFLLLLFVFLKISYGYSQDTLTKSNFGIILKVDVFLSVYSIIYNNKVFDVGLEKLFNNRNSIAMHGMYSNYTNTKSKSSKLTKQMLIDYKFFIQNSNEYSGL